MVGKECRVEPLVAEDSDRPSIARMFIHKYALYGCFCALSLFMPLHAIAAELAVTLPPLAGLVKMLEPDAKPLCLLPAGADPHHFQMQPRALERLAASRLLIRSSRDDGGWPLPAKHLAELDLWPGLDHGWVSPKAVRAVLPHLAAVLQRLHPERAAAIDAHLQEAIAATDKIAQQWYQLLNRQRSSGVMMQHPSWRRLMRDMDVPILAVLESTHHGSEHGPHALEDALAALAKQPDAWLIFDADHRNRSLAWLAAHHAGALHTLHFQAMNSCGMSWVEMMQANMQQLRNSHE